MNRPEVMTLDVAQRPGSARFFGALGHVSGLTYSFTTAGGADEMSLTLNKPASYRTDAMNPGRHVRVTLGATDVWTGILDEPQPSDSGWQITAHGAGQLGGDYMADFTTWDNNPDEAVNRAIARGLPWINPGIGSPEGMWLGQRADPGSLSVTDLLNLVCTRGGLMWYVSTRPRGNQLSVVPLPVNVNRILVANGPVARTIGADINALWVRYKLPYPGLPPFTNVPPPTRFYNSADVPEKNYNVPQYRTTYVTNDASIAKHGLMESFVDFSSGHGTTEATAQARAQFILDRYQRASFAGPFTVHHGQLTTTGGHPVNLATEQARTVCKLILTDYGYGGEVIPGSPQIITGQYQYSVDDGVGTITPFQSLRKDFATLMSTIVQTRGHGAGDWQRRGSRG